ncbi:hypothetical protein BDQ17DRAFT_266086 [Cyathus striatus]|nr:hypothetical protein BDQ17DRAFT_266086 [Cyathus striatus]
MRSLLLPLRRRKRTPCRRRIYLLLRRTGKRSPYRRMHPKLCLRRPRRRRCTWQKKRRRRCRRLLEAGEKGWFGWRGGGVLLCEAAVGVFMFMFEVDVGVLVLPLEVGLAFIGTIELLLLVEGGVGNPLPPVFLEVEAVITVDPPLLLRALSEPTPSNLSNPGSPTFRLTIVSSASSSLSNLPSSSTPSSESKSPIMTTSPHAPTDPEGDDPSAERTCAEICVLEKSRWARRSGEGRVKVVVGVICVIVIMNRRVGYV